MKLLVTCPPMLGLMDELKNEIEGRNLEAYRAEVVQTLTEAELIELVPKFDAWICGDDPVTKSVVEAGVAGQLKALIKWGAGVDNVDFRACEDASLPVDNTPGMFADEVADVALSYVIGLARGLFCIDRSVREGKWIKPTGSSLRGKKALLVGYGHIGKAILKRLEVIGMEVLVKDPYADIGEELCYHEARDIAELDYVVLCCALNKDTQNTIDRNFLNNVKRGLRIVNVSRGPVIDESALEWAMEEGIVSAVALDVFTEEPLSLESPILRYGASIVGSHNASNTKEAAIRASVSALEKVCSMLGKG